MRCFEAFCTQFSIASPFSVNENLLRCFAPFRADQGLAPQTAQSYLAAARNTQITLRLRILGISPPEGHGGN